MDKFTVDIDQVLNDFEYSELTDQYSNGSEVDRKSNTSTNYTQNNTVTKHSINNVFHSLNEYLNTSINEKPAVPFGDDASKKIDNKIFKESAVESVVTNSEQTDCDNTLKLDDFLSENNQKFSELTEAVQEKEETKIEEKINELEEEIDGKQEGFDINTNDDNISEKFVVDCAENEKVVEANNVILNNLKDSDANSEETIKLEEPKNEEESAEINVEIVEIHNNENNLEVDNNSIEEIPIESEISDKDIIKDTSENCESIVSEIEQPVNCTNTVDETTTAEPSETDEQKPDIVSFNDDLNLDDSELNKLLEELEFEQELNESLQDENEIESREADSLARPQDLPLKEPNTDDRRTIDLVGGPGSTPYNNVYVSKEIPKVQSQDSDTDYSTSASPTFSDISTESTSTASTVSVEGAERRKAEENGEGKVRENLEECRNVVADESVQVNPSENVAISDNLQPEPSEHRNPSASGDTNSDDGKAWIGKQAPLWVPDGDATSCLQCDMKFTVLKRRHHCRACGLVLCSKCCYLRFKLEYLEAEARVCNKCYNILNRGETHSSSASETSPECGNSPFRPNPSNPLEYCSTVPPSQQMAGGSSNPPAVMVPVGVLKRKGSNKTKHNKSVMFCDGIKPGSDLTNLDNDFNYTHKHEKKAEHTKEKKEKEVAAKPKNNKNLPVVDPETKCFIPSGENSLPPTVTVNKTDVTYTECSNTPSVVEMLKNESLTFAIDVNLSVHVKIINMSCCINKIAWCFTTEGLMNVGNDEIVYLIEYIDEESFVPKDIFFHIHNIFLDAVKGTTIKEMGLSLNTTSNFLDDKNHAGFVYVRPTFQCVENVIQPNEPYLVGILIHRWETPWAKLFPLRLVLRLGAEYRYYPSPLISTRHRESMFVEIGHTIINLLADFRNFSYTIPQVRGLTIHMEDKNTTINIPINRYEAVIKTINNSSEHILAFAGNFSILADSHLVCIQDTQDSSATNNNYSTHAINIHNRPRKVTGASFIVFNGALKSSSGLSAKSNIVEDGLMIQVLPEEMRKLRDALRAMNGYTISCGCVGGPGDEVVNIIWGENDTNFNLGIKSSIDKMLLSGIPSIRVHNGKDYICHSGNRLIRWTEVFILKNGEENPKNQDPVDISKVSESIAKATCNALVKYLDLLATNSFYKIGIRTTLHVENVSYSAGSNGVKLPPIYMKSLDNELIPVLHRISSNNLGDNHVELELVFRILNV